MSQKPVSEKKDERIAIVASLLVLFGFFLVLILSSFEMADPPPKDIPMKAALMEMPEFIIKPANIDGGGSGKPSDDKIDKPRPQTEKIATQAKSKTSTASGESNKTTAPNANNEASTTSKAPNPFGGGGSGGGDQSGKGKGFGNDEGSSTGPGEGTKQRIRLTDPNADDIKSGTNCIVRLKVTVNAEGDVVKAENISSITTTTDQRIINQVIAITKAQAKYNKKPGASLEQAFITVTLKGS
jgi:hypothetical protein